MVTLGFNEDEYIETEANETFDVVVRQLEPRKVLDSDIVLRLIPMDYTFAINNGIFTGASIPFNPNVPNRAVGKSTIKLKYYLNSHDICISIIIIYDVSE